MPFLNLEAAAAIIRDGGLVIYPTETFLALGCRADNAPAVSAIFGIKGRLPEKTAPLIAANNGQAARYADLDAAPARLIRQFWPGPLTLVLPAKIYLAPGLINPQHKVALRISACAVAVELAARVDAPLVATSANLAGVWPAGKIAELPADLLASCASSPLFGGILAPDCEQPRRCLPSTLVEPVKSTTGHKLRILREGAITKQQLLQRKWNII